jgi:hypothetical protein
VSLVCRHRYKSGRQPKSGDVRGRGGRSTGLHALDKGLWVQRHKGGPRGAEMIAQFNDVQTTFLLTCSSYNILYRHGHLISYLPFSGYRRGRRPRSISDLW